MALPDADATILATLASLEDRLHRLTFYLTGDDSSPSDTISDSPNSAVLKKATSTGPNATAQARLSTLESRLAKLASQSHAVKQLLDLESIHPSFFHPQPSPIVEEPSTEIMRTSVLAHAPLYAATSSQLQSLKDLPPPPVSASASLIALHPRLTLAEETQQQQETEVAALRERSAQLLQRWYEVGVLGWGQCWQEWEARLERVEQKVRREEGRREREEMV